MRSVLRSGCREYYKIPSTNGYCILLLLEFYTHLEEEIPFLRDQEITLSSLGQSVQLHSRYCINSYEHKLLTPLSLAYITQSSDLLELSTRDAVIGLRCCIPGSQ